MGLLQRALRHPLSGFANWVPLGIDSWFSQKSDERKMAATADKVAQVFQAMPHLFPQEEKDPTVKSAKTFLKTAAKAYPQNPTIKKCQKEFLAFKLGIPSKALDERINPGFEQFAKETHLERALIVFNHQLKVDETGAIHILYQGRMQPWSTVKEVALAPIPRQELPRLYNPPLKYASDGVQSKSCYEWTELKPFKIEENAPWAGRYVLALCCLCIGSLRLAGDHTWIELLGPDGSIWPVGLYREDNDRWSAFVTKRGELQSPDISIFWPETIHRTFFEITEEDFLKIKAKTERDHKEKQIPFHLVGHNCTHYALDLARLAGIDIPVHESFVSHFIPIQLQRGAQKIRAELPGPLKGFVDRVWSSVHYLLCIVFNGIQVVLGGTRVSGSLSIRRQTAPHITSLKDLFKRSKLDFQSPWTLAYTLPTILAKAREEEAKRRNVDASELRYWVPDAFRSKNFC